MKLVYRTKEGYLDKDVNGNNGFFLSNNKGDFFINFLNEQSRYEGLFYHDNGIVYKTISRIIPFPETDVEELVVYDSYTSKKRKNIEEQFLMPESKASLLYKTNKPSWLFLELDFFKTTDVKEFGRLYKIKINENEIIVEFEQEKEFKLYLIIEGAIKAEKLDQWVEKKYSFDEKRKSAPWQRYVYRGLKLFGEQITFAIGKTESEARERLNQAVKKIPKSVSKKKILLDKDVAYRQALQSIKKDIVVDEINGVMAGLPWFYQFWTRDSVISANAIAKVDRKFSKQLLLSIIGQLQDDGRLPNLLNEKSKLKNADAVGWLFLRCKESWNLFTAHEKRFVEQKLLDAINNLTKNYNKDGFVVNDPLETWMDTEQGKDNRAGVCIEIQALTLAMYEFAYDITKKDIYKKLEQDLTRKVKSLFFKNNVLADKLSDFTVRPNIFIAYYAYPELLQQHEWEKVFDNLIDKLWLKWGGFATIAKDHQLFVDEYSGEYPKSYHRGDSWFWINNLAAICMHRLNKEKFKQYIDNIVSASVQDILWQGIAGSHAELSSTKELRAEGCMIQTWSNAMFVELIDCLSVEK